MKNTKEEEITLLYFTSAWGEHFEFKNSEECQKFARWLEKVESQHKKELQAAREEGRREERGRAVEIIEGFISRLAPEGELLYELHENIKYHFKKTIEAIEGDAKGGAHNEN